MVNKGLKSKDELLLEDETPFELASMAVFKMLNEWEAKGFELPYDLEDILYTSHLYLPVKERLGWIRGSNLGFSTTLEVTNFFCVLKSFSKLGIIIREIMAVFI